MHIERIFGVFIDLYMYMTHAPAYNFFDLEFPSRWYVRFRACNRDPDFKNIRYSQLLYNQDFFIVQMNPRLEIAGFFEVPATILKWTIFIYSTYSNISMHVCKVEAPASYQWSYNPYKWHTKI